MVLKKLREIFSTSQEVEKDYSEILRESGLLQKIENLRLETSEKPGDYKLYPCHKEYYPELSGTLIYDYNRFDRESSQHRVDLGNFYFKIRTSTNGVYLSFRNTQKDKVITRNRIDPMKVSEKEIQNWFSLLAKYSKR